MQLTWGDRMEAKAERRGKKIGEANGLRMSLSRLLLKKFPDLPPSALERINAIHSPDELLSLIDRLLDANSPHDLGLVD